MSSIAALSAPLGAALFAPTRTSTTATLPPREFPFDEPRRLDEFMDGDLSEAERVIFYMPRAMLASKLDLAAELFRFWLFRDAVPPYRLPPAPEGAGRPRGGEPRTVRGRERELDTFLLPYDRLLAESARLRKCDTALRAQAGAELVKRAGRRNTATHGTEFDDQARKQWGNLFAEVAALPPGGKKPFGNFDRFDGPELAVTFLPIEERDPIAIVNSVDNVDASLGAYGLAAYVTGTATRGKNTTELTFSSLGIRVRDVFEFSGPQWLGVWSIDRGLSLRGSTESLSNSTFAAFAADFRPRYNERVAKLARAGIVAPPLRCEDVFVTSRMTRDERWTHLPIVVPDPAK